MGFRWERPVVFAGGVVGRISEVHQYTSTVELLSNSYLRMAVIIEGDNRPMSFREAGSGYSDRPSVSHSMFPPTLPSIRVIRLEYLPQVWAASFRQGFI